MPLELPGDIFGMPVRAGSEFGFDGYPLLYGAGYAAREVAIGRMRCIAVEPKGGVRPSQCEKLACEVETREGKPCLLVVPRATAYQRRSLSGRGVAWLSSDNTFHIPFLATSSLASELRPAPKGALSPRAQQVAARVIDGSWLGLTTSEVAAELGVSLSSAVNYLKEIEAAVPGAVKSRGRTRFLSDAGLNAAQRYEAFRPRLPSPVVGRAYLKARGATVKAPQLPVSGVTALARVTMIADDPWETRAARVGDKGAAAAIAEGFEEVTRDDEPDLLLERWAYDPGPGAVVRGVPLLLDLESLAAAEGDERLDSALAELKGKVLV